MGIRVPIRLKSIEAYIVAVHGSARGLATTEIRILNRWAGDMVTEIEDAWPVDTSTSRDGFDYAVEERPGWIGIVIENDVDYVQYVHYAGESADEPLWETLIPSVFEANKGGLLAALRTEIARTEAFIKSEARIPGGKSERRILTSSDRTPTRVQAPRQKVA